MRSASEQLAPVQHVICCYWRLTHYGGQQCDTDHRRDRGQHVSVGVNFFIVHFRQFITIVLPIRFSRGGCSFQFGRTSKWRPRAQHFAHTILLANDGTSTSLSANSITVTKTNCPNGGVCCGDGRYKDFFSCEPPSTGLKGGDRAGSKEKTQQLGWASLGK